MGAVWGTGLWLNKHLERTPAVGATYTEGLIGAPALINPLFASLNDVDADMSALIFSGLIKFDQNGQSVVDLAESYTVSEDKKVYTFRLRPNIFWHDSATDAPQVLTARDVAFTFERIQNPDTHSPLSITFDGVIVEAVDQQTVRFTLPQPFAPFLSTLTVGILPEHIWESIPPEQMRFSQRNIAQPVGSGPFKADRLERDESGHIIRFQVLRFAEFYSPAAYLDSLNFRFFSDYEGEGGALRALKERRIDGLGFVPTAQKGNIASKYITLHTAEVPEYTALFFNPDHQVVLKEKSLRTALAYALDKTRLVNEAVGGEGQLIESPILPGTPGYHDLPATPYDMTKANALLDSLWPSVSAENFRTTRSAAIRKSLDSEKNASTTPEEITLEVEKQVATEMTDTQTIYRVNKSGAPLTLNLVTADTPEYRAIASVVAAAWRDLGIRTIINFVPAKDIGRTTIKDRAYDVLLYSVLIGSDPDQYLFWHSSQVDHPGLNLASYKNEVVDKLLDKIRASHSLEQANPFYSTLEDTLAADRPAIWLYRPTYTYAVESSIRGVGVKRVFRPTDRLNDITAWYQKTQWKWKS